MNFIENWLSASSNDYKIWINSGSEYFKKAKAENMEEVFDFIVKISKACCVLAPICSEISSCTLSDSFYSMNEST